MAVAAVGLILSILVPGWALALIFIVLLAYLWKMRTRRSKRMLLDQPSKAEQRRQRQERQRDNQSRTDTPKRSSKPEGYRSLEWKGLIFRSASEIRIAKTLDHRGIFFIPPARVRLNAGKDSRQSRELDFVICHEGKWGVLEVDGPFHVREADAERDGWLRAHGIRNIQRFPSQRCFQEPQRVIDEFLHHLENMP